MRRFLLFIMVYVCCATTYKKEHLRKIRNTIYDYSNVYNVNVMCNAIERRLISSGIYPNTTGFCVNATIDSKLAPTLSELYSLFKWSDKEYLLERRRDLIIQRQECDTPCDQRNYLGESNVENFIHHVIPDIKWELCYENPDYINITSLAYINKYKAVIHVGRINKYAWSGSYKCLPWKPVKLGPVPTVALQFYRDTCFDCIDRYLENKLDFERSISFYGPTMKTRLRLEIARIWRKQMPQKISEQSVMLGFDV